METGECSANEFSKCDLFMVWAIYAAFEENVCCCWQVQQWRLERGVKNQPDGTWIDMNNDGCTFVDDRV
jgi:hypothetical protein